MTEHTAVGDGDFPEDPFSGMDFDDEKTLEIVTVEGLRRRLAWDIMPCDKIGPETYEMLGIAPASASGEEIEHRLSHDRLNRLLPLIQVVALVAALAGEVVGRAMIDTHGKQLDDDQKNAFIAQSQRQSLAATQAILAELIDLGYIHLGGHP